MRRTLSSPSLTPLFLTRMLGGTVGIVVALYMLAGVQSSAGIGRELVVIATVMVLIVSALIVKDCLTWRRLKKVAADDHFLYVSHHSDSEEVAIPLSDVVRVTQWRGKTLRTVTVYLRSPSKFGERIQFQPALEKGEGGWAWRENRIVHDLRRLAKCTD